MSNVKKIAESVIMIVCLTLSLCSCGNSVSKSKTQKCEKLLKQFAENTTYKDCEEICSLMFTDEMMEDCGKLYLADMKLQITNRNLMFKQSLGDLFDTVEYSFTDTSYEELSDENLEITKYYYSYLGYDVNISDGYWVTTTFSSSAGYKYLANFAIVEIDDKEWKISPQIWEMTFGQRLEPLRKKYTEDDFYSLIP